MLLNDNLIDEGVVALLATVALWSEYNGKLDARLAVAQHKTLVRITLGHDPAPEWRVEVKRDQHFL